MAIDWKQEAQGRERIYFAVFLLLVPVMFGRVLWGPKMAETREIGKELAAIVLQRDTLKDRLAELKKLQAERAAHPEQPEPTTADSTVPSRFAKYLEGKIQSRQAVMGEIVRQLTGPEVMKGLSLNGHSIGSDADAGTYTTVPLELYLEGPFAALVQYFSAVEQVPLLFAVDNISLVSPAEKPGVIQTRLAMTIYVVKSAAAIMSAPTAIPGASGGETK